GTPPGLGDPSHPDTAGGTDQTGRHSGDGENG
ncbi:MAG: hypothetical protein JWR42_2628, partial [Marmoricola sp.]|nr:hypothetical protein [Marmoricola sp.]